MQLNDAAHFRVVLIFLAHLQLNKKERELANYNWCSFWGRTSRWSVGRAKLPTSTGACLTSFFIICPLFLISCLAVFSSLPLVLLTGFHAQSLHTIPNDEFYTSWWRVALTTRSSSPTSKKNSLQYRLTLDNGVHRRAVYLP